MRIYLAGGGSRPYLLMKEKSDADIPRGGGFPLNSISSSIEGSGLDRDLPSIDLPGGRGGVGELSPTPDRWEGL